MEANRTGNCINTVPVIQSVVVFMLVFTHPCKKKNNNNNEKLFLNTRLLADIRNCQLSCMLFLFLIGATLHF